MPDPVDRLVAHWSRELDWLDPLQEEVYVRLAIVARHAARVRREALDTDGLRHWQYKVLLTLRRLGPPYTASPSQLADLLGLSRGALSARLAPLEADGLLNRTNEASDRRRVRVRLTPAGHQTFEQHAGAENRAETALLSALSPQEQRTLAQLLRKLVVPLEPDGARTHSTPPVSRGRTHQ